MESTVKRKPFSKMFAKRESDDWISQVKVDGDDEAATESDGIDMSRDVQDVDCEEVDAFDESQDERATYTNHSSKNISKSKEVPEDRAIIKEEIKTEVSTQNSTNVRIDDITTAMKENEKLTNTIKRLEERLETIEKENDKNLFCRKELKSILVDIGLGEEVDVFEKTKIELIEKNKVIQHLEMVVAENGNFINNLHLGMSQLFEQKPQQSPMIQENQEKKALIQPQQEDKTIIQEKTIEIKPQKEVEVVEIVMKMHKTGKTIRQISYNTELTIQNVEEIIRDEGGTLENVS
ncbi:hypothetical protein [Acetobacterium sp.]|uniref:hypothetical protein n=1 Tax=Acetobacterium sp. TaxID=1872094 RepID=UPI002F407C44